MHCFSQYCDSNVWNFCCISWYTSNWNTIKFCCLQWKLFKNNLGDLLIMAHCVKHFKWYRMQRLDAAWGRAKQYLLWVCFAHDTRLSSLRPRNDAKRYHHGQMSWKIQKFWGQFATSDQSLAIFCTVTPYLVRKCRCLSVDGYCAGASDKKICCRNERQNARIQEVWDRIDVSHLVDCFVDNLQHFVQFKRDLSTDATQHCKAKKYWTSKWLKVTHNLCVIYF